MTQKELLYFEDAIGHENNIIKLIKEKIKKIKDSELKNFFEDELSNHTVLKEKLMETLEEKVNE